MTVETDNAFDSCWKAEAKNLALPVPAPPVAPGGASQQESLSPPPTLRLSLGVGVFWGSQEESPPSKNATGRYRGQSQPKTPAVSKA